jgi:hypothetical protein
MRKEPKYCPRLGQQNYGHLNYSSFSWYLHIQSYRILGLDHQQRPGPVSPSPNVVPPWHDLSTADHGRNRGNVHVDATHSAVRVHIMNCGIQPFRVLLLRAKFNGADRVQFTKR